MIHRRTLRGTRRPVVLDLCVSVAVWSLMMAGLRMTLAIDLFPMHRPFAILAILGVPALAALYGASAAIDMRSGWVGATMMTGMLHALLVVGSLIGIAFLAICDPMASVMAIAAEAIVLLWSSSWL